MIIMKDRELKLNKLTEVIGGMTTQGFYTGRKTMTPSNTNFTLPSSGTKSKEVSAMFFKAKSVYEDALSGNYPKFYIDGCKAEYDKALDLYTHTF
jgi:hypothetical protein